MWFVLLMFLYNAMTTEYEYITNEITLEQEYAAPQETAINTVTKSAFNPDNEYPPQADKVKKEKAVQEASEKQESSREHPQVIFLNEITTTTMFLGDSRTVGMQTAIGNLPNVIWVCKVGGNYNWLMNGTVNIYDMECTPADAADMFLTANPQGTLYFNLGVNDMGDVSLYTAYINSLSEKFPEANIYYMSVNPVYDDMCAGNGYYASNEKISTFNTAVLSALSDKIVWIDTYTYLMENGYGTFDGLHYDNNTYKAIYNYVLERSNSNDTGCE